MEIERGRPKQRGREKYSRPERSRHLRGNTRKMLPKTPHHAKEQLILPREENTAAAIRRIIDVIGSSNGVFPKTRNVG